MAVLDPTRPTGRSRARCWQSKTPRRARCSPRAHPVAADAGAAGPTLRAAVRCRRPSHSGYGSCPQARPSSLAAAPPARVPEVKGRVLSQLFRERLELAAVAAGLAPCGLAVTLIELATRTPTNGRTVRAAHHSTSRNHTRRPPSMTKTIGEGTTSQTPTATLPGPSVTSSVHRREDSVEHDREPEASDRSQRRGRARAPSRHPDADRQDPRKAGCRLDEGARVGTR